MSGELPVHPRHGRRRRARRRADPESRYPLAAAVELPRTLDILVFGAEQISKRMAKRADNRVQIRAFAAGEVAPPLQVPDAVQNGTIKAGTRRCIAATARTRR